MTGKSRRKADKWTPFSSLFADLCGVFPTLQVHGGGLWLAAHDRELYEDEWERGARVDAPAAEEARRRRQEARAPEAVQHHGRPRDPATAKEGEEEAAVRKQGQGPRSRSQKKTKESLK